MNSEVLNHPLAIDEQVIRSTGVQPSDKNYMVAVCLSGVFGVLGIHHFYLGRYLEGLLDLTLALIALFLYVNGNVGLALLVFAIDSIHALIVTVMLWQGSIKDGLGRLVCYPGQRLTPGEY
jgi:TM2 domain-containing membrane protein YozV